jgi:NAD(P)-dependent dehydrogenase (short-subunit alcohol dehydrogenase family)
VAQRFAGKSVVITGAGAGIGLGYARAFAAEGASVTIADVDATAANAAAGAIAPSMVARGGGVVLNQSSNSSYLGVGAYSISKMALNAVTLSLAQELAGDGIRCWGSPPEWWRPTPCWAALTSPSRPWSWRGSW